MAIKYRTGWHRDVIERIEVERETEHSVWVGGSREGRWTSYHKYHDTWHNARAYLKDRVTNALKSYEKNAEDARKELAKISAMTEPEEQPNEII